MGIPINMIETHVYVFVHDVTDKYFFDLTNIANLKTWPGVLAFTHFQRSSHAQLDTTYKTVPFSSIVTR